MDTDKNLLCVISFATQASDIPLYLKANTFHQELDEEEEEREKKKIQLRKYVKLYLTHNRNVHRVHLGRNNKPDIGKRMTVCCLGCGEDKCGSEHSRVTHAFFPHRRSGNVPFT